MAERGDDAGARWHPATIDP